MKINYNIKPLQIITRENVKVGYILTCIQTTNMSGTKNRCFTKNKKYQILSITFNSDKNQYDIKVIDDRQEEHYFDIGSKTFTNKKFRI